MQYLLHARYYNIDEESSERYLIQTQSQAKSSGIKLTEVHSIGKSLDLSIQTEKQVIQPIAVTKVREVLHIKPRLGQGRAGLRCKIKMQITKLIAQVMEKPPSKILVPNTSKIQDTAMPIPNYTIPSVTLKGDTGTKMIDRRIIQDVDKEFLFVQILFIDPSLTSKNIYT